MPYLPAPWVIMIGVGDMEFTTRMPAPRSWRLMTLIHLHPATLAGGQGKQWMGSLSLHVISFSCTTPSADYVCVGSLR